LFVKRFSYCGALLYCIVSVNHTRKYPVIARLTQWRLSRSKTTESKCVLSLPLENNEWTPRDLFIAERPQKFTAHSKHFIYSDRLEPGLWNSNTTLLRAQNSNTILKLDVNEKKPFPGLRRRYLTACRHSNTVNVPLRI